MPYIFKKIYNFIYFYGIILIEIFYFKIRKKMVSFNSFILLGFSLRIFIVLVGTFKTVQIIGFSNLNFLKKYIQKSFFLVPTLFYWSISFLSILYFEHLVSNAKYVTFSQVYDKSASLTIVVILLLLGVIAYAYLVAKQSSKNTRETKKKLKLAQNLKKTSNILSSTLCLFPSNLFIKGGAFIFFRWGNYKINSKVKKELSAHIIVIIKNMLLIALVNLLIIMISVYLITEEIIFW